MESNKYSWLSLSASPVPDRTEFLKHLYVAIVENLAAKQAAPVPTSVKGVPTRIDSLKIALTPSGTLSHLDDPAGILNQRVVWWSKQVSPEAMQQLSEARLDFNSPNTFTVSSGRFYSRFVLTMPALDSQAIFSTLPLPNTGPDSEYCDSQQQNGCRFRQSPHRVGET